ncbi:hypothetical protein [Rhodopila globiformis]|uniref:hypothetical protein n=1 Tax=Rhodopila globiformis TaxID=1071 RepID=UPI0011B0E9E9|nr:hypothetical protein [Rhodopila globiformis]
MQASPVQIGDINLQDFEIPPSIRFGGRHRVVIHKLSGGNRVIERLGPDDGDIYFSGTFSGPYAEARMRAMDSLRLTGEVVWLTWDSFRYQVIVRTFVANFHNPWWIPYQVGCVVVQQPGANNAVDLMLYPSVAADLAYAAAAAIGAGIELGTLQAAVTASNALTVGTSDHSQSIAAIKSSVASIDQRISDASNSMMSQIDVKADAPIRQRMFGNTVTAAGALAAAVVTKAYVGRVGTSLTSAGGSGA